MNFDVLNWSQRDLSTLLMALWAIIVFMQFFQMKLLNWFVFLLLYIAFCFSRRLLSEQDEMIQFMKKSLFKINEKLGDEDDGQTINA